MTKTDENKNLKFDHAKSEIVKHYWLATLGVFNKDIYGLNSSLPVATIEISKTTTATKKYIIITSTKTIQQSTRNNAISCIIEDLE